jgi:EAL domain-containing protein (putative c-di-GMP-specific phosphodiesterase class I)
MMDISTLSFLVVEDHPFQRYMLEGILADLGATRVHVADEGRTALEMLRMPRAAIDIVISDLDMPGMDGMEFMRHLGEERLPVSIILASSLERTVLSSVEMMTREYGVTILGVIEKPITREGLASLIAVHKRHEPEASGGGPALCVPAFSVDEILAAVRNDEFEPFFQPKVALADGAVKGVEALARWRHPEKGIVSPFAFIKVMEEFGIVDDLTWVMLEKSAAFCAEWRESTGMDVTVSVNLSTRSLSNVHLAERVTDIVRAAGCDPGHMVLEVTESATTTDLGMALENLSRLRMKGFGLSIDDYGTGFSSMQQLSRIAFTEIKIDQSFVSSAAGQGSARVILESTLEMAKRLRITSVAEGVETIDQWNMLLEIGYVLAQGYLIAKPMQRSAMLTWKPEALAA